MIIYFDNVKKKQKQKQKQNDVIYQKYETLILFFSMKSAKLNKF